MHSTFGGGLEKLERAETSEYRGEGEKNYERGGWPFWVAEFPPVGYSWVAHFSDNKKSVLGQKFIVL